jgi:hypothetical protein
VVAVIRKAEAGFTVPHFPAGRPSCSPPRQPTHASRRHSFAYIRTPARSSCHRVAPARLLSIHTLGAHDLLSGTSEFDRPLRLASSTSHSTCALSRASYTRFTTLRRNIGHDLSGIPAPAHDERASPGQEEQLASSSRRPRPHFAYEWYVIHFSQRLSFRHSWDGFQR